MALSVTALGMITSVGRSAATSCAAIRAGMTMPRPLRHHLLVDPRTQDALPATGHPVRELTEGFGAIGRWLRLAHRAVADLVQSAGLPDGTDDRFWGRTGLVLALPVLDPDRFLEVHQVGADEVKQKCCEQLLRVLRLPIAAGEALVLDLGHAGAASALALAERRIAGGVDRVMVIGVDSYLDERSLEWLAEHDRLKAPETPAGLMPGEAGAAVLVEPAAGARRREAAVQAVVERVAVDVEPRHFFSDLPSAGEALSRALRGVITAPLDGDVVVDLNGELWRAAEWGSTRVRLSSLLRGAASEIVPAMSLGDTGAAGGVAGVCLAARAFARGHASSERVIVVSSSEHGPVGAIALRSVEAGG